MQAARYDTLSPQSPERTGPIVEFALSEKLDTESIIAKILGLTGYHPKKHYNSFRDLFELWTPERAFAVHVLAQALKDIEQLDAIIPNGIESSPKKLTEWAEKQRAARENRIAIQQSLEECLRTEYKSIVSSFRSELRAFYSFKSHNPRYKGRKALKASADYKALRRKHDTLLSSFLSKADDIDSLNSAVSWFENDLAAVSLWCELAGVEIVRCYLGVQRRLELLGRCSIKIHQRIKELRRQPRHPKEVRTAKIEDEAWTPFSIPIKRKEQAISFLRQLPRDEVKFKPQDRAFIHRMNRLITSDGVVGSKQLQRLAKLAAKSNGN